MFYSGSTSTDGFGLWKHGVHAYNNSYIIFHAGNNGDRLDLAPFKVLQNDAMEASAGKIGDFSITNGKLYVKRSDGLESEISKDGFHLWRVEEDSSPTVLWNLIDIGIDDITTYDRTKITNTQISCLSYRQSNAGYAVVGTNTAHNYYLYWDNTNLHMFVDTTDVGIIGRASNGYAPFTGNIPIINSITANGDGSISWTYSNIHVSNGVITGYS